MLFAYEIRCSYFFCGSFLKSYTLRKVEKKFVPFRKTRTIFVYSLFCFFFSLSNLKLERAKDQRQLSILSVMNVILVQFYLLIVSNKPAISRLSFDPWLSYLPRSNGVGNLSATESRWFFFSRGKTNRAWRCWPCSIVEKDYSKVCVKLPAKTTELLVKTYKGHKLSFSTAWKVPFQTFWVLYTLKRGQRG